MNHFKILCIVFLLVFLPAALGSCKEEKLPDAMGTFEGIETIVSAEASGVINAFQIEEGQHVQKGAFIGYIDTTMLHLQKMEIQARIAATLSKRPNIGKQLASMQTELKDAQTHLNRVTNLYKDGAATQQQLDHAQTKVATLKEQIRAKESALYIQTRSLDKSAAPLNIQIKQIEEKLEDHLILNPASGTVLATYAGRYETTAMGAPLYKIADLSSLILRAYITGNQFSKIQLGQHVQVKVDDGKGRFKTYEGQIIWISNKAEFTPKTIRTKEERAHLVYAIKIRVENDGYLKIGMVGEVELEDAIQDSTMNK